MMRPISYIYYYAESCNMCGADSSKFKIKGKRLNTAQGFRPHKKIGITTTIVKCTNCGLVFANPLPMPENIQDHYGVPADDYWQKEYFSLAKVKEQPYQFTDKLGKIYPGYRSLDIGAGIGKHMLQMQDLGIDAYGIEPSKTFIKKAFELTEIKENRLLCTTIEDAEFANDFFDFINLGAVLEHLPNPSVALAKAVKWLKPSGKIYIEVPHANWVVGRLINASYKVRGLDYVTNLSPQHPPYHLFEFTKKSFELNARINNYRILSISYFVCKTFLPPIFDYPLKSIMKKTNTGMELSVWLGKSSTPNKY